jgi:hypothetical protein
MLHLLLVVVLVPVLLSFLGGYSGYVPSHFGYGGGGVGLINLDRFGRAAAALSPRGRRAITRRILAGAARRRRRISPAACIGR